MILKIISDDSEGRYEWLFGYFDEIRGVKQLLEAPARLEQYAHIGDIAWGNIAGEIGALARDADAERTEIAQFHDPALGKLVGDNVHECLEHGGGVHAADGGHLVDALGDPVGIDAAGAFDRRIILGLRVLITRIFAGSYIKFDWHC